MVKIGLPDRREGVYNADTGELITDLSKKGTYNYANPDGAGGYVMHLFADVLPYIFFGDQG